MSSPAPVLTLHGFLELDICRQLRDAMDAGVCEEAEVLQPGEEGTAAQMTVRRATGVEVGAVALSTIEVALDAVKSTLEAFFDRTLVEREGSGFLRYGPGGLYRPHRDWAEVAGWPGAARREIAVIVFLNSGRAAGPHGEFEGGWLRLYSAVADEIGEPAAHTAPGAATLDIVPRAGTLVAFLARQWHEVTPVTAGTRDVVVDWYY
jgi:predicted 2-oxoglutarate/Fe(II)-dependent dioxygenase YbiX